MTSNNAPKTFWYRFEMACGIVRHKLYVDEQETPYFVDDAKKAGKCHWSMGGPISLHGAGMGETINRIPRGGGGYRIARFLGGFKRVELAKGNAEQRALADLDQKVAA